MKALLLFSVMVLVSILFIGCEDMEDQEPQTVRGNIYMIEQVNAYTLIHLDNYDTDKTYHFAIFGHDSSLRSGQMIEVTFDPDVAITVSYAQVQRDGSLKFKDRRLPEVTSYEVLPEESNSGLRD